VQGHSGRILYSGREGSHFGRVPDAVKEWKKRKGKAIWDGYWVLQQQ